MSRFLLAFVIGSSLPVTVWPLLGLAIADGRNSTPQLDFSVVGLVFPLIFGLGNVLTVTVFPNASRARTFAIGALLGLGLASTGTFLLNVPGNVYHLEGSSRYIALLLGPLFYGLVWALPLFWLNGRLLSPETASELE